MSYSGDVFARFGPELELFDSLLSQASSLSEDNFDADASVSTDGIRDQDDDDKTDAESQLIQERKKPVQDIFAAIRPSDAASTLPSRKTLLSLLDNLDQLSSDVNGSEAAHAEELKVLALSRLVCASYAVAVDALLQDAGRLEQETWYWTEIEESMRKTLGFLVQTLPVRLARAVRETLELAAETASSTLRNTLDSSSSATIAKSLDKQTLKATLRNIVNTPNLVTSMLFPYTFHLERSITLKSLPHTKLAEKTGPGEKDNVAVTASSLSTKSKSKRQRIKSIRATMLTLTPTYLARHEAKCKRRGLIHERDQLAQRLGQLALQQDALAAEEQSLTTSTTSDPKEAVLSQLNAKLRTMTECFRDPTSSAGELAAGEHRIEMESSLSADAMLGTLRFFLKEQLPQQQDRTRLVLSPESFGQPSGLTQRWPSLVFYPLGLLVVARYLSKNWNGIEAKLQEAKETAKSFAISWVWEPCVGLLDTIRHGNEGTVIISRESLNSDLQSLERMVSDFTADKYGIKGPELEAIAARVREGDLTHVLKVYEAEMKNPVKSMVSGNLIRSLLIQIQKAKVDLEVAMSGIDKLLKSQQLLFGAVGIAPALGMLYIGQRYVRSKISGITTYRSRWQGQNYQIRAWEALRRVDRLLASSEVAPASTVGRNAVGRSSPQSSNRVQAAEDEDKQDALTHGLLLLDLSMLRSASGPLLLTLAKGNRSSAKRLQKHFLQDIRDIERGQRSAVERMWRSWGSVLHAA
ncbi:NCA2-domain-containing protein [Testicularia cyperi]|uniref:NCA2-domain-containing protein n=1 Tax=Testicularia cyperi TaxID=1882483 RepID=A0A317XT30_9BASI|nr:NCA2-domain-containing protein [Testicularia cyperi]